MVLPTGKLNVTGTVNIKNQNDSLGLDVVGSPGTLVPGLFDGEPISTGDLVVRFGWWGDANVDGQVDINDYNILASNFGDAGNWFQGDFNYDGVIDANDYGILADEYGGAVPFQLLPAAENEPYSFTLPGDNVINGGLLSTITSWQVRWGDGSYTNYPVSDGDSPNVTATHTYASPNVGGYQLAIVATGIDDNGNYTSYILPHQDLVITPDAPTDLAATESAAGEVDLTWADDTAVATNYVVTASPTTGGAATITQTVDAYTFGASFTGLTPDVNYLFSVTAVNTLADGISTQSNPVTFTATAPAASLSVAGPATINEGSTGNELTLTSGSGSNVTVWQIVWTDASGNVLSTDTVTGANGTDAFPSSTTAVLFATVKAYDATGGAFIEPTIESDVTPLAPTDVVATMYSSTEIDLSWTNNSAIATEYDIQRSIDGGAFEDIGSVDGGVSSFADTGLDPSDAAVYTVFAMNTAGTANPSIISSPATSSSVTTPTGVPTLTVKANVDNTDSAFLRWTYQGNDDAGFEIEMEDQTIGENFHTVDVVGAVNPSGWETTNFYDLNVGDTYLFRIRADYTDGTVSAYVGGSVTITSEILPNLSVSAVTIGRTPLLLVGWSGILPEASVTIETRGTPFPGDAWHLITYSSNEDGGWPSDYQGDQSGTPITGYGGGLQGYILNPMVIGAGTYQYRIRSTDDDGNPTAWTSPQSGTIGSMSDGGSLSLTSTDTTITAAMTVTVPPNESGPVTLYMDKDGTGETFPDGLGLMEVFEGTETDSSGDGTTLLFTYTASNLSPSTTYDFVLCTDPDPDDGEFPESAQFAKGSIATTGTATGIVPAAPQAASAVYDPSIPGGQIKLAWLNTSSNETGFNICLTRPGLFGTLFTLVGSTNTDETTYTYKPTGDGPYTFAIFAVNSAGESTTYATASCAAIGGPDISSHLLAINRDLQNQWNKMTPAQQSILSGQFGWNPWQPQTANWDINALFAQSVSTPHNSGILPDGTHTVTVNGEVFDDAIVNYWLYGCMARIMNLNTVLCEDKIKLWSYGHLRFGDSVTGRVAWFEAGYSGAFSAADGSALPDIQPAQAPPIGEDCGGLGWKIGTAPNSRWGND
jgi:hypothetical protein